MAKKEKLTKETAAIIQKGTAIEEMVKSEGWREAKRMLFDKLITFDSLTGIPKENRGLAEIGQEAVMREAVVQHVLQWVREVEGEAQKAEFNKQIVENIRRDSIVRIWDEQETINN